MIESKPDVEAESRYNMRRTAKILGVHYTSVGRWAKTGLLKVGYRKGTGMPYVTGTEILRFWTAHY